MPRSRRSVPTFLVAAAVLVGGCSDGGDRAPAAGPAPSVAASRASAGAVQSAASILRANLTTLLQEHVYLTGATAATAIAAQDTAPAAAVLDANSVKLSYVIGTVYGEAGAAQFLDLWRRHIGLLLDFARSSAAADEAGTSAAKEGLVAYQEQFASFLNTANPNLAKAAMVADQKSYLGGLQSAITALATGDAAAPAKVKTAAEHMPRTATVLVAGITKNHPGMFEGRVDGSAATLRSVLAAKFQEHAYLSWIAAGVIAEGGDAKDAVEAVDENSVELANIIGSTYGDEAAKTFLELWRVQVVSYVDYARARSAGDTTGAPAAAGRLAAEPGKVAAFLHAANPYLDQAALAADLSAHSRSLLAAIDAQAVGAPSRFADISAAASAAPGMAARLSTGIATQFPARFS